MAYRLGPFRLDVEAGVLFRDAEVVPLGQRAVTLLRVLVERPQVPVSKDSLMQAAWPGLAVEEGNLTVQIAALRRALAAAPGGERWIETLPRRGYRFVGPFAEERPREGAPLRERAADPEPSGAPAPDDAPVRATEPERRHLTVASCELIQAAGASLDVEDLHGMVSAFRRCVADTLGRHGAIAGHVGNTVIVYFGYPAAHEYDAEQAVRAALDLCTAVEALSMGPALSCRVGIASGSAITGDLAGSGEAQAGAIVGEAATVAGLLQGRAAAGSVVIDETTRSLIGDLFVCRDLAPTDKASGLAPGSAWQVLGAGGVDSRFEALRGGRATDLVGREEELAMLRRRWVQARGGEGQVVLLAGEPGIGKSRLAQALQDQVADEPHSRLRFFCTPHHVNSALYPIVRQLERMIQPAAGDGPAQAHARLAAVAAQGTGQIAHAAALLAALLGLPGDARDPLPDMSPQKRKEQTFAVLLDLIDGQARQGPVLILFEDLHWVDPTSLELLSLLIERTPSLPILVVATFRPEFDPPWSGQPHVTTILLNRLGVRQGAALVRQVAGDAVLLGPIVEQIASKADGIPLFIEELTKAVLETGVHRPAESSDAWRNALAIPGSLHASLLARLDHAGLAREIAQVGAAIGREFSYELLAAVADQADGDLRDKLERLVAAGLLFRRGVPPDATYIFKHALVQDAAYGMLLRNRRQQLHARIAAILEQRYASIAETQPEVLAHHHTNAGAPATAVGFWLKAAQLAVRRSAAREAAAHASKGIALLQALPPGRQRDVTELALQSTLGAASLAGKGAAAAETISAFERARDLMRSTGDTALAASVLTGLNYAYFNMADHQRAAAIGAELLEAAQRQQDSASLCVAHQMLTVAHLMFGDYALARRHADSAWAAYDAEKHRPLAYRYAYELGVGAMTNLGFSYWNLGYVDQAAGFTAQARAMAEVAAHRNTLGYALCYAGAIPAYTARNFADLGDFSRRLKALGVEHSMPQWTAWAMCLEARALAETGDANEALRQARAGLAARDRIGNLSMRPMLLALIAELQIASGQPDEALRTLEEAISAAHQMSERYMNSELWRLQGDALLAKKGRKALPDIIQRYRRAVDTNQTAQIFRLRAATSLAKLLAETGERRQAYALLTPVHASFTEGLGAADVVAARDLLDSLR